MSHIGIFEFVHDLNLFDLVFYVIQIISSKFLKFFLPLDNGINVHARFSVADIWIANLVILIGFSIVGMQARWTFFN